MDGKNGETAGAPKISESPLLIDTMEAYAKHLTAENLSPETVMAYGAGVMRYLGWHWRSRGAYPAGLRRKSVLDFRTYLLTAARFAPDTVDLLISALSDYNGYLIYMNRQSEVAVRAQDRVGNMPGRYGAGIPETAEVESFRRRVLEKNGARDYAIVTVMAYAGLGHGEISNLRTDDISFVEMAITVRKGSGGTCRIMRLNNKTSEALRRYLQTENHDGEYLFPGRRKEKIPESMIGRIFGKFPDGVTSRGLKRFFRSHEGDPARRLYSRF